MLSIKELQLELAKWQYIIHLNELASGYDAAGSDEKNASLERMEKYQRKVLDLLIELDALVEKDLSNEGN